MLEMHNQFNNQNFSNIESFRKNGQGVKTPVWFVQDGEILYVRSGDGSGKVKRIRKNSQVQVAPCKADETPVGGWVLARAMEMTDPETDRHVDSLLGKKYGFQKMLFALVSRLRGDRYTVLKIEFSPN
jgi:PPOX class probable F420-dependent enzyme